MGVSRWGSSVWCSTEVEICPLVLAVPVPACWGGLQVVIGLLAYFSESARDLFLRPEWGWRWPWPRDTF